MNTSTPDEHDDEAPQGQLGNDPEEIEGKDEPTPESTGREEENNATEEPPRRTNRKRSDPFGIDKIGQGYPFNVKDTLGEMINSPLVRMVEDANRSVPRTSQWLNDVINTGQWMDSLSKEVRLQAKLSDDLASRVADHYPEDVKRAILNHAKHAQEVKAKVDDLALSTTQETQPGSIGANEADGTQEGVPEKAVELHEEVYELDVHRLSLEQLIRLTEKMDQQIHDSTIQWRVSTFVTVMALAVTALAISGNSIIGEIAKTIAGWPWYITWPVSIIMLGLAWTAVAAWNSRGEGTKDDTWVITCLTFLVNKTSLVFGGITTVLRWARILPREKVNPEELKGTATETSEGSHLPDQG